MFSLFRACRASVFSLRHSYGKQKMRRTALFHAACGLPCSALYTWMLLTNLSRCRHVTAMVGLEAAPMVLEETPRRALEVVD